MFLFSIFAQEFKCEICGNYSYWGRRAFEKHFKEWRHQNGMRALGIPNNKNFYEITKIEDAVALWENMKVFPLSSLLLLLIDMFKYNQSHF